MTVLRRAIRVMDSTMGRPDPIKAQAGGYRWNGDPEADDPAAIVARLHAEIAAKSPEHATLVADFERIAPLTEPRTGYGLKEYNAQLAAERMRRLREYATLRQSGLTKTEVRLQMGLKRTAGERYEADMHLATDEIEAAS